MPCAGSIPSELGQLGNLEVLRLERNTLTGGCTPACNQTNKLTLFPFVGSIPSELGQLGNLDCLDLSGNELQGERDRHWSV